MATATLASSHAQRKNRQLAITFGGLLLFAPLYVLGNHLIDAGLTTALFVHTLLLAVIPYLVAGSLIYQSLQLPRSERATLLFINSIAPFPGMVLLLALLQQPYSRSAVLLAATSTLFWYWLSNRLWQQQRAMQLLLIEPEAEHALEQQLGEEYRSVLEKEIACIHWRTNENPLPLSDGALVTEPGRLSITQQEQLYRIKREHIRLYSLPALTEMITGRKNSQELQNPLWQPDGNPAYDTVKRIIDLLIVILTAPLWLPLGMLVAAAVKLDSSGPALFSQTRTGLHGRPFRIWKFRTMQPEKESKARFAQQGDKRITRIGRILRKSRLDEIPQLVNVLLGHMSLIGPRPEQHSFVKDFAIGIPSYPYRHLVRPGLTGWAQVMQGYAASEAETTTKLSYDLYYVSHYSLALDLLIATKTIKTILTGHGAR